MTTTDDPGRARTLYHRLSGGSLERLAAISDGIFAVTLTLLVLDLHVPVSEEVRRQRPLWAAGALDASRRCGRRCVTSGPTRWRSR